MSFDLNIKCTNGDKFSVQASPDTLIQDLRSIIEEKHAVPADQQRLIFKGHVLKDEKTLGSYGVQAGNTIILVKGTKKAAEKPTVTPSPASAPSGNAESVGLASAAAPAQSEIPAAAANPFAFNPLMGAFGQNPSAGGMPNMADMQRQLLENPDMMAQVMNSPMMQSLLDNPELMQQMMMNNPTIRQMMETNPELSHILNDPAVIRQSMELARNPNLMREMTRNTDRAMNNIEAHPEGFNALRRMYENVQEPMMGALNPQNSAQDTTNISNDDGQTPADAPLPNPWAPTGNSQAQQQSSMSSNGSAPVNPFASMMGAGGFGQNPMAMNPEAMTQMLENPFVQQMMRNMMSNPETLESMIAANPATRQMLDSNPQMREMIRNPEFLSMMSDPNTMRAMLQLQRAFGGSGAGLGPNPFGQSGANSNPPVNPFGSFGSAGVNPWAAMLGNPPAAAAGTSSGGPYEGFRPEILYRDQLAQLNGMGFTDAQANINALIQTGGNIEAAIDRLLGGL